MQSRVSAALQMRAFNRFYTERIGALDDRHEGLAITLAESRCLFTIRRLGAPDVSGISGALGLDLGYVSRLVSRLERAGHIRRTRADDDRRRRLVTLTPCGVGLLAEVERRSNDRMDEISAHLRRPEKKELLTAMETIQRLLDTDDAR